MRRLMAAAGLAVLVGACDMFGPPDCPDIDMPGLVVTVVDSVDASLIRGFPLVIASEGTYADTSAAELLRTMSQEWRDTVTVEFAFGLAYERPGTYTVTVEHPNYQLWQVAGVPVKAGKCHVETLQVQAILQPRLVP